MPISHPVGKAHFTGSHSTRIKKLLHDRKPILLFWLPFQLASLMCINEPMMLAGASGADNCKSHSMSRTAKPTVRELRVASI
jgi:hypothetical protein